MSRADSPPFARGETYANGNAYILSTTNPENQGGLGGINLEGKEYMFEVNSQDQASGYPGPNDASGRPIWVKVLRNLSSVNLKPGRIARYNLADATGYECSTDGYAYQLSDRPAGVIDEFLPAAGVLPNDLFYVVIEGPTVFTQPATAVSVVAGNIVVPAATGSSPTDDLAGRVALQDLTGATATLGHNIINAIGYVAATNDANNAQYAGVVRFGGH